MTEISITIPGQPQAWERAGHNGRSGAWYTPKKTSLFEGELADLAMIAMVGKPLFAGPLCVRWTAYFSVPPSWPKWKREDAEAGRLVPTGTPDLDNLYKCKDGLTGIVWKDDSQVTTASLHKAYSADPRTDILIFPAPGMGANQVTRRDQLVTA